MITQSSPQDNRQRIWQVVAAIPSGKVASYGQVAALADLPRAARLVGSILKNLPPDSKLPWHRVIRSDGKLAFPTGSERYLRQQDRLEDEGVTVIKGRISRQCFQW
jgi:methylated-DNA-protein-cysteine methyltransferase related protein